MFGRIGIWEFVIILAVVLILFGPAKLPELARSLGQALKELKRALKGGLEEETEPVKADDEK